MVQHKKTTAERWIDPNTRDSAGSPVMGVRGKYESPVRDQSRVFFIVFSIKCLPVDHQSLNDTLPTHRRQLSANIADSDHPDKGPQKIILMDRGWGFDLDSVVMMAWSYREGLLYALYCALGDSCYLCSVAHRLTCFEIADD